LNIKITSVILENIKRLMDKDLIKESEKLVKTSKIKVEDSSILSWNDKLSEKIFGETVKPSQQRQSMLSNALFIVASLASISIYLTVYAIYSRSDTGGIAIGAILFAMFVSFIWLLYTIFVVHNCIIIASSGTLLLANTILLLITIYVRYFVEDRDEYKEEHKDDSNFKSFCCIFTKNK